MTREEAEAIGALRYDSDAPCVHGHKPERYTRSGICVQCAAMNTAKTREKRARRFQASDQGLVDLSGVTVRPGDVESVMAFVDACNLMSGAPKSKPPVAYPATILGRGRGPLPASYRVFVGDLVNAYVKAPTTSGLAALTAALLGYGEQGPAAVPADQHEVLEVLDAVHQYIADGTAQSWNFVAGHINRGPLVREGGRRGAVPDRMRPEPPLPAGVRPSYVYEGGA